MCTRSLYLRRYCALVHGTEQDAQLAQSPEGLALVSLCRALRISCHTSWHPSVRAMNPPPMATELTPLRPASGKRASFSLVSWKTAATVVGCVAFAGVSAYASGLVPASSLGMARLGSEDVEGADPSHPDPEPAHDEVDSPGFTDIVYTDDALGYLRSIVDVSPCFVVCANKENPEALITAAFANNNSTCADINAALADSVCLAEECMDDCVQREYHTKIAADAPRRRCRRGDAQDACPRGQRAKLRPGTVPGLYRGEGRRGGRRRRGSLERDPRLPRVPRQPA